jgi:hypothetical protein
MSQPDPLNAIYCLLKADAALTARVGTRVFNKELPPAETVSMPRACVVISPAGGGAIGRGYQQYGDVRVDAFCYGATLNEAWLVYLDVKAAMKRINRQVAATVLVHWAKESSGGTLARDPTSEWPVGLASWQVLVAEVAVA